MEGSLVEKLIPLWRDYNYALVKLERMEMKKLEEAIKTLQEELAKDKSEGSYYYSWQANIAMSFMDLITVDGEIEGSLKNENPKVTVYTVEKLHELSNQAAKNFLDLLIKQ